MTTKDTIAKAAVVGVSAAAGAALALAIQKKVSTSIEKPKKLELEPRIVAALEAARRECGDGKWGPDDGATATAWVAYQMSDNAFIFPITPSTLLSEMCDTWSAGGVQNAFEQVTKITQLQSEAGAAGSMHGALSVGGLATTFTASQGLLLMVPNMYKIAGELIPCVMHVAARAVAGQALSIFGDQNDIQAVRSTGFAILFGSSVQQAVDFALASHIATLRSRVPFVHAFDGFRTSHEIQKIQAYPKEIFQKVVELLAPEIDAHRARGLNPNHPHARGTAQCDDIYFQAVEAANKYYLDVPHYVEEAFAWIEKLSGRSYSLFEYVGSKSAKYVLIIMGSGAGVVEEYLTKMGDKAKDCGCLNVHLYRPWSEKHFLAALPALSGLRAVAVCNKMKDPAAHGEPLFLDVCTSLQRANCTARVINGRYGLSSKDFTPGMVEAIYQNLRSRNPKHPFTVGLEDDVTHYSLPYGRLETVPETTKQCIFWGFGSDGTVGANKNTIKIIAQNTQLYAQGYFKYDALKSGGVTISHLRFGPEPIKGSYLIDAGCNYLAIHKKEYIFSFFADLLLGPLADGGTLVLNCPWSDAEMDTVLPPPFRKIVGQKRLKVCAIDASAVAKRTGMGKLINNIMTAVFFELSGVLPTEQALALLKDAVKKTYKNKGDAIVNQNIKAVEAAIEALRTVQYDATKWAALDCDRESYYIKERGEEPPAYVVDVLDKVQTMRGHELKVSEIEADGCVPLSQTRFAKRGVAESVPVVDMDKCIQCNVCSAICPHAVIRPFLLSHTELQQAPDSFDARKATGGNTFAGLHFRIQASPNDCTGCEVCTNACPVGALSMMPRLETVQKGHAANWDYALTIPNRGQRFDANTLKGSQFQEPLLEFSGACEGCGETPYAKLVTQMFGKRLIVANATGCSSIWGGTAGWVPYATDKATGKGAAWGNSLFEDNAEYGLGQVIHVRQRRRQLRDRVEAALARAGKSMSTALRSLLEQWLEFGEDGSISERLSDELQPLLEAEKEKAKEIAEILRLKDLFTKPSMWMFGGDGWANDIGYGGIDHAIASGNNVKIVVLDTEVYSNTGGQSSKSTPMGAVAKFAQAGRDQRKKDLGAMAMAYQHVYVASVAIGANYKQTVEAFAEAEKYDGPALLMCYAPCIEHRFFKTGLSAMSLDQKDAVECGYWPLYRFNPKLSREGRNPFILDSKKVTGDVMKFLNRQNRYAQLVRSSPAVAEKLQGELQVYLKQRHSALREKAAAELSKEATSLKDGLKQAESAAEQVLIAFGSDTGVTEQVAKKFAGLCKDRGVVVRRVCDLDELSDMEDLKAACAGAVCVVMCSTCGHGDFPQNAGLFWSSLSAQNLASKELSDLRFCVFGMGDRSYADSFCEAAKKIEERMLELGAERLLEMGIGDDRDEEKWETGFLKWLPKLWLTLKAPEPEDDGRPKDPLFEVKYHDMAAVHTSPIVPPGAQLLSVVENKRMTPAGYERDIRHVALSKDGVDFPFDLGDAVAIYPENLPQDVDEALQFLSLDGNRVISVKCSENVSEHGPITTPREADRKDIGRKLISERDEVLSLEKELAALQLSLKEADPPGHFKESSPEDQSALPRALSTGPEGPVGAVAERAPEGQDGQSGELEKKDASADIAPKAKAMAACPGRTSRSSLPKPPPPKAKPAPKAKVRAQAPDEETEREDGTSSRLVNLHWRASQAPPEETEIFVGKDGYLQCMSTMMERWGMDRAERMRQSIQSFEGRAGAVEAERHDAEREAERDPKQTPSRRRRKTVFNAADVVPIPELPQNQLEDLFAARAATFDIGARSASTSDVSSLIVDSTHQRILDLMVRSEAMQRQRESGNIRNDAVEHAVTELLATLQSCDFSRLTRSVLNDLRKVVVHHLEGGHNILSFVESRGVEALSRLEHPHLHQLLYGVLRIPGISTRLECMDLVAKFPAELESCREDLQILRRALLQIRDRQAAFRSFWSMAMHLGNTLNGSAAGGFRLSSLSKLLDLKSPDRKEMTFFHFVLLQLPPATVEALTDLELLNALKTASSKRTHTVHQDVLVHLDGFRRLEGLVATGSFKGESIPAMDGDPFHRAMADFVRESQGACAELWASSMQVFQSYRDMGIFFQDLSYVYPPPGGAEEDRRKDLFGVLGNFVAECAKAQQEIDGSKDGAMGLGVQVLDVGSSSRLCAGPGAARVRGEFETSSVEFISSSHSSFDYSSRSSSESSSSFGHSDSSQRDQKHNQNDPHHDLHTQLKEELRRRRNSGSLGSTHSARSTPRSSGSGPSYVDYAGGSMSGPSQVTEAMLATFMAVPRKSRTPPLSPVKERGETPYRIACQ